MEDLTGGELTTGQCAGVEAIWLSPEQPHFPILDSTGNAGPAAPGRSLGPMDAGKAAPIRTERQAAVSRRLSHRAHDIRRGSRSGVGAALFAGLGARAGGPPRPSGSSGRKAWQGRRLRARPSATAPCPCLGVASSALRDRDRACGTGRNRPDGPDLTRDGPDQPERCSEARGQPERGRSGREQRLGGQPKLLRVVEQRRRKL